jgi:hypothetical protein
MTLAAMGAIRHEWWNQVASSEAPERFHWAMCPTSYSLIRMVIEIASNLPAFFVDIDYLFAHNLR